VDGKERKIDDGLIEGKVWNSTGFCCVQDLSRFIANGKLCNVSCAPFAVMLEQYLWMKELWSVFGIPL
jgi:hypothetical protein